MAAFGAGEGRARGHGAVLSACGCLTWDISIKKTEEGTEEGGREGGRGRLLCHDDDDADEAGWKDREFCCCVPQPEQPGSGQDRFLSLGQARCVPPTPEVRGGKVPREPWAR